MAELTDLVIVLKVANPTDQRVAQIRTSIKTLLTNNSDISLQELTFLRQVRDAKEL